MLREETAVEAREAVRSGTQETNASRPLYANQTCSHVIGWRKIYATTITTEQEPKSSRAEGEGRHSCPRASESVRLLAALLNPLSTCRL